jgi:hypothetical protein
MAINFSARFAMMLLALHIIAAMLVYLTVMAPEVQLAMLLLVLLSLIYYLARDVFFILPDSWHEISFDRDGLVVSRHGSNFLGRVANESTVCPYFIVLRVKLEGHYLTDSRVIFPDALSEGVFREICVRMKFA